MKFGSAVNKETVCDKCPCNYFKQKVREIPGGEFVQTWVSHLFWLDILRKVGCVFQPNALTKEEWDGLILLETTRAEIELERIEKAKRDRQLRAAQSQTSVRK